ncbi:alpha/beta fold hydrolase [Kitasatospora kifunensis]|uniref:Proline iminopeptidase n=1 Tax=Kitasatospora kifunensis TaxID=58351 RepID=A0A7W7R861_KITKI|nr:alpha/beta hydrolase [Kitasatospora kifunensis]MBB4926903.1 proline iminopeptidase [Kitasatospora kifunensis]
MHSEMDGVTEELVTADDGGLLWTTASGTRGSRAFVFCHGGPGFWDTLGPIAELLDDVAFSVRWDQRGAGRSNHRGPYSVDRCIADLEAVRRHYELDRISVLGHSWGATLALQYALAHPDRVERLVYISGTGLSWDWYPEYEARQNAALAPHQARLTALAAKPELTDAERREQDLLYITADFPDPTTAPAHAEDQVTPWFPADPACNSAVNAETRSWDEQDLIKQCQALDVPTLIIDGSRDPRPRSAIDSLHRALPDVRRVVLERAGHVPWVDDDSSFASALRSFVVGSDV